MSLLTRISTALPLLALLGGCKAPQTDANAISAPWKDDFERPTLGEDWRDTGGNWTIKDGAIRGQGAYNHPLWLKKSLPRNVRIEFDTWSMSPDGDLKVEVFGDGRTFDPDRGSYTASSYVLIMGGWKNSLSKIARQDEHRKQDPSRGDVKVEPGRKYHWVIERQGNKLDWSMDGKPFLSMTDVDPLIGSNHQYFGVGNWETEVYLDNLVITPL